MYKMYIGIGICERRDLNEESVVEYVKQISIRFSHIGLHVFSQIFIAVLCTHNFQTMYFLFKSVVLVSYGHAQQ